MTKKEEKVTIPLGDGAELLVPRQNINVEGKVSNTGKSKTHFMATGKVKLNGDVAKIRVMVYTPIEESQVQELSL